MRIVHQDLLECADLSQVEFDRTRRHLEAMEQPEPGFETAMAFLVSGWVRYADAHTLLYKAPIGQSPYLAARWAKVGAGLLGLLIGEVGRLDNCVLANVIEDALLIEGFDPNTM